MVQGVQSVEVEMNEEEEKNEEMEIGGRTVELAETDTILNDPELRKLINQSNCTFLSSKNIPRNVDRKRLILELSREHRSTIRECIENMERSMDENKSDNYNQWVDILDNLDHIWHLSEILYIDSIPADIILPKLLEWIRLRSSDYDITASEVLSESQTKGADHRYPKYWELIMGLLIQGRFEAARALLKLHSEADSDAFIEADLLLSGMPKYSVYCGLSSGEFNARWRGWKSSVRSKLKSGVFSSQPKLLEIMKIVGGEDGLYSLLRAHCPTWYQLMIGLLLFTDQTVKITDLSFYANECIEYYGGHSTLKLFDQTILALLDSNLPLAIKKLQLTADGGWCSLHLANLLKVSGVLNNFQNSKFGSDGGKIQLRKMMYSYGLMLIRHQSYWQVGVTYLEHCKRKGMDTIEKYLLELPLLMEDKAMRIVHVAQDLRLDKVVKETCKKMALMKIDTEQNLPAALSWALISNDTDLALKIADSYLNKYAIGYSETELLCREVLEHLGQSILVNGRLTFLAKYCEFHTLYEARNFKDAGQLLIRLLDSKIAPKYFWLTLLLDSLTVMETPGQVFSHDEITLLMACLEEITTDCVNDIPKGPNFHKQVDSIRTSLAVNFSKTLLMESGNVSNAHHLKCY